MDDIFNQLSWNIIDEQPGTMLENHHQPPLFLVHNYAGLPAALSSTPRPVVTDAGAEDDDTGDSTFVEMSTYKLTAKSR